jgi:hypothetical protein
VFCASHGNLIRVQERAPPGARRLPSVTPGVGSTCCPACHATAAAGAHKCACRPSRVAACGRLALHANIPTRRAATAAATGASSCAASRAASSAAAAGAPSSSAGRAATAAAAAASPCAADRAASAAAIGTAARSAGRTASAAAGVAGPATAGQQAVGPPPPIWHAAAPPPTRLGQATSHELHGQASSGLREQRGDQSATAAAGSEGVAGLIPPPAPAPAPWTAPAPAPPIITSSCMSHHRPRPACLPACLLSHTCRSLANHRHSPHGAHRTVRAARQLTAPLGCAGGWVGWAAALAWRRRIRSSAPVALSSCRQDTDGGPRRSPWQQPSGPTCVVYWCSLCSSAPPSTTLRLRPSPRLISCRLRPVCCTWGGGWPVSWGRHAPSPGPPPPIAGC